MSKAFRAIGKDLIRRVYNELITPGRPPDRRRQLAIDLQTYENTLSHDHEKYEATIDKLSKEIKELSKANVSLADEQTRAVDNTLEVCGEVCGVVEKKWRAAENEAYGRARQWEKLKAYILKQCGDTESKYNRAARAIGFPGFLLDRMEEEISSLRDVLDRMDLIEKDGYEYPAPCNSQR